MNIGFSLTLEGLARRLMADDMFEDGVKAASEQAKEEIKTNFDVGGRPAWDAPNDLVITGELKRACSSEAQIDEIDEGFELSAASGHEVVAAVQDERYGIFVLPDEAQQAVADAFEQGALEG